MFRLPDQPGTRLTREELLFSWALGESYSPRWQKATLEAVSGRLREKIEQGETSDFTKKEQQELIAAFTERRSYFVSEYVDKSNEYKIIPLPADQIGKIVVLPTFGWKDHPVPLNEFIDGESNESWKYDPRNPAREFLKNPPPVIFTGYPIVAYSPPLKSIVLIDGYARCITALWRMREGETLPPVMMVYCKPALGNSGLGQP